ncbi:MAG: zf-HC2 domain-containing protein [Acidimicrobiales bacterium]
MTTPSNYQWPIDQARIDRNWRAITIELDAPRPGRIERLLRFVGLPAHVTRLVVATPALRRAWFLATGLAVLIGLGAFEAERPIQSLFIPLLIAPLLPVLGVSMAYGAESDPAHEMGIATPMRGLRLILTRAAVVLAFSSFWLAITALFAPGTSPMVFAWLIPSLGLTLATVALMTIVRPRQAAAIAGGLWVVGVLIVRAGADNAVAAFTAPGQLAMLLVAVAALGVTVLRRDRFDLLELDR